MDEKSYSIRLFNMMYEKSFKYQPDNPFTLVSGNISPLYFDCKATLFDVEGLRLVSQMFLKDILSGSYVPMLVGGLTMGADPITFAVSRLADGMGIEIKPVVIRKEAKGHGTKKFIEGNYKEGESIVIVDDVITTGGSTIKAIDAARHAGLHVVRAMVLVDREEFNGRQNIENLGVRVTSIFTAKDFTSMYSERLDGEEDNVD